VGKIPHLERLSKLFFWNFPKGTRHSEIDLTPVGSREPKNQRTAATQASAANGGLAGAPQFTDAEPAALALTEAATRLSDRADPVPDAIWEEATRALRRIVDRTFFVASARLRRTQGVQWNV
jgi:hypothetical protein